MRVVLFLAAAAAALLVAPAAFASAWWPHPADATWQYSWSESVNNPTPTKEAVTVKSTSSSGFTLAWTTDGQDNPDGTPSETGTIDFRDTSAGLLDMNWISNAPPDAFPVLCPQVLRCGNSLVGTLYSVIWGAYQQLLLPEPLLAGTVWSTTGGASGDVSADSAFLGLERVSVPAFPQPVLAAKVRSQIAQAGALGDPYGSGIRTVWWVYGVGPVKVVFQHGGGAGAPVTTAQLEATNQTPQQTPPTTNYFPLQQGLHGTFRWTNTKHLAKPETEKFTIDQAAGGSARFTVSSVSGPIKAAGQYLYSTRLDGVQPIDANVRAASLAKLPPLGPASLPAKKRRHMFTPFDLLNWGFGPIITAYPRVGDTWRSGNARDFALYGVTGTTRIVGVRTVKVPAGKFRALVVRSTLKQRGFRFGSGTRTIWLAPGRGLVKLVFRHADGSTSVVTRIH